MTPFRLPDSLLSKPCVLFWSPLDEQSYHLCTEAVWLIAPIASYTAVCSFPTNSHITTHTAWPQAPPGTFDYYSTLFAFLLALFIPISLPLSIPGHTPKFLLFRFRTLHLVLSLHHSSLLTRSFLPPIKCRKYQPTKLPNRLGPSSSPPEEARSSSPLFPCISARIPGFYQGT